MVGRHQRQSAPVIAALIAIGLMAGAFGGWLREPDAPKRPAALTQWARPRASPTPEPQAERRPVSVVFVPTRAPAGELRAPARPLQRIPRARPRCPEGFREWPLLLRWCARHGYDVR